MRASTKVFPADTSRQQYAAPSPCRNQHLKILLCQANNSPFSFFLPHIIVKALITTLVKRPNSLAFTHSRVTEIKKKNLSNPVHLTSPFASLGVVVRLVRFWLTTIISLRMFEVFFSWTIPELLLAFARPSSYHVKRLLDRLLELRFSRVLPSIFYPQFEDRIMVFRISIIDVVHLTNDKRESLSSSRHFRSFIRLFFQ